MKNDLPKIGMIYHHHNFKFSLYHHQHPILLLLCYQVLAFHLQYLLFSASVLLMIFLRKEKFLILISLYFIRYIKLHPVSLPQCHFISFPLNRRCYFIWWIKHGDLILIDKHGHQDNIILLLHFLLSVLSPSFDSASHNMFLWLHGVESSVFRCKSNLCQI